MTISSTFSSYWANGFKQEDFYGKFPISWKSMRVRPESVTHLVVKLFNVKSKFDYIDENKQKSEIANNDKFEKRN
jgi:hypothetical protein